MQLSINMGSIDKALPSREKLTKIAKTYALTLQSVALFLESSRLF